MVIFYSEICSAGAVCGSAFDGSIRPEESNRLGQQDLLNQTVHPVVLFDLGADFLRGRVGVHRLVPDALVDVVARDFDLLLLGDAMKDEVGFQPMRRESAGRLNQLFFLILVEASSGTPRSRLRCTSSESALRVSCFNKFGGSSNWIRSFRNFTICCSRAFST